MLSRSSSHTVKEAVERQFSQVAADYANSLVHQQGDEFQTMIELAELTGSERILDAGCGPGHTALTFAPHVAHVTAVDLSKAMLDQGRRLAMERGLGNVSFELGDVERLPFEDGSFDRIVTRYSAHHWPAPEKALAEFHRVLRMGPDLNPKLIIADVVSFSDCTVDTHLQTLELLRDASHVRDHLPEQWIDMLDAAGFHASLSMEWSLRIDFKSWVERMRTPADKVALLRILLTEAPDVVRESLQIEPSSDFGFRCALITGIPKL